MNKRILCFALILAILLTALPGCGKSAAKQDPQIPQEAAATEETAPRRNARSGIQTILVLCLDSYDAAENASGLRNNIRADFMLLLVVDEQQNKITSVQLNPDSMVSFAAPGKSEKTDMPVGLVYSYGSGGSDSCLNVTKAVSGLLGGVKIDHYLTFTMDSVGVVNDMIGGVSVPNSDFLGDVSDKETVKLSGADAVKFFSFRDENDTANDSHLERQRQYMNGLYPPFMAKAKDDSFLTKLSLKLGDKMSTDLTLSQLILMFETLEKFRMEEDIVTLPGEARTADGIHQFFPDQNALAETMELLIYG